MKFENIREFLELTKDCQFCGKPLGSRLKPKGTPNFLPRFNMTFEGTEFYDPMERELNNTFTNRRGPEITYGSKLEDDYFHFYYKFNSSLYKIFSINLDNNNLIGEKEKVQKVIWDHKLVVSRFCLDAECNHKNAYICDSSMLMMERVNKKLFPFFLAMEVLTITHNNNLYGLMTPYEMQATFLMARREVLKQVPLMALYKIQGRDNIYNKIRTLVNFS